MAKVLVTGHLGYVGSVVAPELGRRGFRVEGMDTGFFQDCLLGPHEDIPGRRVDIRDLVPSDLEGFDAIVHLAALSNDPMGALDESLTREINLEGTLKLASAARSAGVKRFVFASSCSLYGKGDDKALDEEGTLVPQTAYARSKVEAERGLKALAGEDFAPIFLRFATAYGFSPRLRLDLVVNNLVAQAMIDGHMPVWNDGSPWRPLIHLRDMANAIAAVLEAPVESVRGQAFNAGRDEDNHQVKDIASAVQAAFPGSRVTLNHDAAPDTRSYRVSFAKIQAEVPGFKPQWTLARGIAELKEAYLRLGLDGGRSHGGDFIRLKHLQTLMDAGKVSADLHWKVGKDTPKG